ncbi:MAG: transposase [Candidatus Nanopelagicales bacterium]|nr:transposase [Candidatus Nanopelagicales bacterium]MDZ4249257.1 transposase [Candidatus Nanopelagicales bacterium]
MGAQRKRYTSAFRREAARLVIDTGRPIAHVAGEIGVRGASGEDQAAAWRTLPLSKHVSAKPMIRRQGFAS